MRKNLECIFDKLVGSKDLSLAQNLYVHSLWGDDPYLAEVMREAIIAIVEGGTEASGIKAAKEVFLKQKLYDFKGAVRQEFEILFKDDKRLESPIEEAVKRFFERLPLNRTVETIQMNQFRTTGLIATEKQWILGRIYDLFKNPTATSLTPRSTKPWISFERNTKNGEQKKFTPHPRVFTRGLIML